VVKSPKGFALRSNIDYLGKAGANCTRQRKREQESRRAGDKGARGKEKKAGIFLD